MMKTIYKVFIYLAFVSSTMSAIGQDQSINIAVASPKVKAVDNKENLRTIIKSEIEKSIVQISDYVTLVERDYLDQINIRRKRLKKDDNPNIAAAAMIGANYLLESKVSEVKFDEGKKVVSKLIKGKKTSTRENRYVYWNTVEYTIDFELVDIETGEVASQYRMSSDGLGYESLERKSPNHVALMSKALTESGQCMSNVIQYMVMSTLLVNTRVLTISKTKKDKAKTILIDGGYSSPFRNGLKFDIVKVYTQEMGGESVERKEKIGEAKYKNKYDRISECSVSDGEKEVLKAYNEGASLYCVPTDLKHMETCWQFLSVASKVKNAKGYKAALTPSPKASSSNKKSSSSSSSTKTKSTKKVTRKKGK